MSVTTPTYVNATSTASACTFYGGPSCVVEFKPAFAYWGNALLVSTDSTTTRIVTQTSVPPIATTRYYVDPASNHTVSSSLICNWSLYESDYYNQGTTTTNPDSYPSTAPGYYTVNSQCSLLGVFPGLLDSNGTWHHLTATYPNELVAMGNTIRITTRACPSATHSIVTTSITYTDEFASYLETYHPSGVSGVDSSTSIAFPWWTFPDLTKYLSDLPELSSCSISLGGSPATLRGATYLTENVVLPRSTQASSTQAKQPVPESSTISRPSAEPEPAESTPASPVSRPDPVPTSSAQPVASPTVPDNNDAPSTDNSTPNNAGTGDSSTDNTGVDDAAPSSPSVPPAQDDEDSSPINQDPIWSAIGDVGEDESNTTPASDETSSAGNTNNSGGSQDVEDSTPNSTENPNAPGDGTPISAADQSGNGSDAEASSSDSDEPQQPGSSPTVAPAGVVITVTSSGTSVSFTVEPADGDSDDAIQSIVSANGASAVGNALVVGAQTIEAGGPAVTISNNGATQVLSVPAQSRGPAIVVTATGASGQEAVVTLSADSTTDRDAVQSIVAAQGAVVDGNAVIIGSQTLIPGGSAVTLAGSDYTGVVGLPVPSDDLISVNVAGQDDGEIETVSIVSHGDLNDSEVQSLLSANDARVTNGVLVVGTQILTPGGAGITLTDDGQTQVISLPAQTQAAAASAALTIGSQIVYPGGTPITITSDGKTQVISLPTILPGGTGLLSSVVVANTSTTATENVGDYICSVLGSCSTAVDGSKSDQMSSSATATDADVDTATPTGAAGKPESLCLVSLALVIVAVVVALL